MTQLAASVNSTAELWTLDSLPASPYVQVEDELVEIRARFPEHVYLPTETLVPPKVRVNRAVAGTTAATHANGTALTAVYGVGTGGGGGGALPDWFVPDENNQTFDFFGGFHLHTTDDPNDPGDVSVTIDGRDSASSEIINVSPTATGRVGLILDMPNGQTAKPIIVSIDGDERLRVNNNGTFESIPNGTTKMLSVTPNEVEIVGSQLYVDDTVVSLFGGNGSDGSTVIADATDPASTMARLNDLLAELRLLGLIG